MVRPPFHKQAQAASYMHGCGCDSSSNGDSMRDVVIFSYDAFNADGASVYCYDVFPVRSQLTRLLHPPLPPVSIPHLPRTTARDIISSVGLKSWSGTVAAITQQGHQRAYPRAPTQVGGTEKQDERSGRTSCWTDMPNLCLVWDSTWACLARCV